MKHNVYLDFMNLCHRARVGQNVYDGDMVTFNFFRQLRLLIETLQPDKIFVVFEGNPIQKKQLYPEYKINRVISDEDSIAVQRRESFWKQVDQIRNLLQYFPVTFVCHPTNEADDTIYNFVKQRLDIDNLCTIVSTDTDFIQMLQEFSNSLNPDIHCRLYNPIRKEYVYPPDYSYTMWKSLRGDAADGIPGIPGVGDKTAIKWLNSATLFDEKMKDDKIRNIFQRNLSLIKFETWNNDTFSEVQIQNCVYNSELIKSAFNNLGFKTIIVDKSWKKFDNTFASIL